MLHNNIVEENKIISLFPFGVQRNIFLNLVESVTYRASAIMGLLPWTLDARASQEFEKQVVVKALNIFTASF